MKTAQLSGSLRANVGKKDAAALRNAEMVPCVLYGQGEQTHFAVKRTAIDKIVFSPDVFQVALDIEGKKAVGIIRELQQHPTKDTIQHVDFYELDENKEVRVMYFSSRSLDRDCENDSIIVSTVEYHEESQFLELWYNSSLWQHKNPTQ